MESPAAAQNPAVTRSVKSAARAHPGRGDGWGESGSRWPESALASSGSGSDHTTWMG